MSYDLDRLGWLQFQQLCSRLIELEGGPPAGDWRGEADRCRYVLSERPLGPPLLREPLPDPVLVQCAWVRPGADQAASVAADRLARRDPPELARIRSHLIVSNRQLDLASVHEPAVAHRACLGPPGLSERIDARAALRLEMPSLLGLRALDDLILPSVSARSTLGRAAARELAEVFAPTRAHRRTLAVLAQYSFAVLTGPPEMGKSATARMVALAKMTDGWEAHECTDPDHVWRVRDPRRAQVFVADDAFGSTEYRPDAAERWATGMGRLLRTLDERHWLIWTSRPAPLHAALRRLHRERGAERFPSPARVLVDASQMDAIEKTLILLRHAKAAGLADPVRGELRRFGPNVVGDPHFTPERIRRLVGRLASGDRDLPGAVREELATPTEAMAGSFEALERDHKDLLVALLDCPGGSSVAERELVAALRRHHDGSLSRPPAELVDRLTDHFLRVLA